MKLTGNLHADFDKVFEEYTKLRDRIPGYQERIKSLQTSLNTSEKSKQKQKDDYEAKIAEKDAVIKELTNRLAHMAALADHDGTNTGTSTDGKDGWSDNPARGCYSVGDKAAIYGKEYEVMAIVEVPYYLDPYTVIDEIPFVMKDSVVESLDDAYSVYGSIYCGKDPCAAEKEARAALLGKEEYARNIEVISLEEIKQEVVLFSRLFTVIAFFVSMFLGIILLLYRINTTIFQVQSQKKMIGMLISMGMQKKQFIVTWLFERIYEMITEIGLVVTVGSLLSYYVIRSFCESTAVFVYKYSIFPVCLLDIVMVLLTVGLIIYEFKKMLQKYEVRELLSEE